MATCSAVVDTNNKTVNVELQAGRKEGTAEITVTMTNGSFTKTKTMEVIVTENENILLNVPGDETSGSSFAKEQKGIKLVTDGKYNTGWDTNSYYGVYTYYFTFAKEKFYDVKKMAWNSTNARPISFETSVDGEDFVTFEGFNDKSVAEGDTSFEFTVNYPVVRYLRIGFQAWGGVTSFNLNEIEVYGSLHEGVVNWHPQFTMPYKYNVGIGKEVVVSCDFAMDDEQYEDNFEAVATA